MKVLSKIHHAFLVACLLAACSGNSVYLDIENEQLVSCESSTITYFLITDQKNDTWIIEAKSKALADKVVDLKHFSKKYLVRDPLGKTATFTLKPNSEYMVLHSSIGDAAGFEIYFTTDQQGKINYSSAPSCP
jgi:hypothetical protein